MQETRRIDLLSAVAASIVVFLIVDPGLIRADESFYGRLAEAALERTRHAVRYDGAYLRIPYPGGDVPAEQGVCTDVLIRAYRAVGIDLQKEVHEDMSAHFDAYPKKWGLTAPDTNIDHRRVPNLAVFFSRRGRKLPITNNSGDYRAGDIVAWDLGDGTPHIGIVVEKSIDGAAKPWVVHNIGAGPKFEDVLFQWKITGHYRYGGGAD